VTDKKVQGVNREKSQTKFFSLLPQHITDLSVISKNGQLATWLAFEVFDKVLNQTFTVNSFESMDATFAPEPLPEEIDIAHFIGGFVIRALF